MNNDIASEIALYFDEDIASVYLTGNEVHIRTDKDSLARIAAHVTGNYTGRLVTFHAVDARKTKGTFTLVAVFSLPGDRFAIVEADVPESETAFCSLTPQVYCANWYEREIRDMFGLTPLGHPDLRPLVLYDSWPQDCHPLRKDFKGNVPYAESEYHYRKVEGEGVFEIPVGPVHAGIIEPGHFRFSVAGEPVINLEIRLGYVHKGIEKLSESMPYEKGVFLAERISGDNGLAHSTAYCQAVEKIAGMDVPERAEYLRTVFLELERIYNHLGDVGGIALDTAYNVGAQHAFILRERVLQVNEEICGSRLLRSINRPGGVRRDIAKDDAAKLRTELIKVKLDLNDLVGLITSQPALLDRIETTGVLSAEAAKNLNVVGPGARGSGIDRDVRRDHPYAAYGRLNFHVHTLKEGDVNARMRVKIFELYDSMGIIEQALDTMPGGDIFTPLKEVPAGSVGMSLVEAPRGELAHWILSGEGRPFRHKVRDPSFCNWPAMEIAVPGNIVPDFPLVNKSFNLSYSGNDL
jgi:Ni,Fe-hydrogenase III large subunit/Ni,Fe-hydrogenase III component G